MLYLYILLNTPWVLIAKKKEKYGLQMKQILYVYICKYLIIEKNIKFFL